MTPHERRILTLLASGATRAEAAGIAGIRPRTLQDQLRKLRGRYAPTVEGLIALAVKLGWVVVDAEASGLH